MAVSVLSQYEAKEAFKALMMEPRGQHIIHSPLLTHRIETAL
jgi:hypothetical protein